MVEKRAQITIFMILGFLLLLIFLFLMQVASQAEKSQFLNEQEKAFTKAFKKESLRLFVDDCLQDELEKGLILLGKQGTLWADQPGGIKQFSEGINGLTYSTAEEVGEFHSGRIAYALIDEQYLQFPGAYPCDSESGTPSFCQYHHPNISAGFGAAKLLPSTFTQDLRQYLRERTAWCVQNFILTDISQHAEIVPTDMELDLTINDEGIKVKVDYPLKFKVGGEEIFSLSTFDFFYPSHFNQLLKMATFALTQDKDLVDFNYTEETFTQPTFTYSSEKNVGPCTFDEEGGYFRCERAFPVDTYQSLGITMAKENLPNGNGDDVFIFTPALYEIVNTPEPYSLRIARQNRPPALDYIQRAACPAEGYDYLVIKNDARYGYGDLNIIPHAIDPDEDRFTFSFSQELGPAIEDIVHRTAEDVAEHITAGFHTITVAASDGFKTDSQDVRVLVDRPIQVRLWLDFPESYGVNSHVGGGGDTIPTYVVSREDPILLQATIPAGTETSNIQTIKLSYFDGIQTALSIGLDYRNPFISTEQCYNFPLQREGEVSTCAPGQPYDLNSYYNTEERINRLTDFNYYTFQPFQRISDPASPGTLSLNFNTDYCGVAIPEQRSEIKVQVAACVPVQNPEHPFAYPYHEFTFGTAVDDGGNTVTDFSNFNPVPQPINPLEATHSCCIGDPESPSGWQVAEEGTICFTDPRPDCYNEIEGLTSLSSNRGSVWEIKKRACDGVRGNICSQENVVSELYGGKLWCGEPSPRCNRVEDDCKNSAAFGFIDSNDDGSNDGWCHGRMGCELACPGGVGISYIGSLADTGPVPNFPSDKINQKATELAIEQDFGGTDFENSDSFPFRCGCSGQRDSTPCDKTYDGMFTDVCDSGECVGLICPVGAKECASANSWKQCNELGTAYGVTTLCPSGQFCADDGECREPICPAPFYQWCFDGFVTWLRNNYPEEVQEMESASAEERRVTAFFCDERGMDIEDVSCSSACNSNTVLVEVSEDEWRCGCRESDWRNERSCLKNGVRKKCERKVVDGRIIPGEFECR